MTSNLPPTRVGTNRPWLLWINTVLAVLSGLGIGIWIWLLQNRSWLPDPSSDTGKRLLKSYSGTSGDVVLALLALCVITLVVLIRRTQEPSTESWRPWRWARSHPLVLALWTGYAVAMVHGSSWFYPELVGWYKDVISDHLLNNFSFRSDFLRETLKRDDYRFFPLAHQDLHILSWFTAYVKVWMLVSAAELFTIVVVSARFIRRLSGRNEIPGLLLITSLLLLFQPSTGTAFFQLIYSERLLTFLFSLYFASYLHHQKTLSATTFYSTILFALLGIFVKDIAIVLFLLPPLLTLALGSIGRMEGYPSLKQGNRNELNNSYKLELWLCSLILVFLASYIALSLLPSTYASSGAYSKGAEWTFRPDLRVWLLLAFSTWRGWRVTTGGSQANLLDCLNLAALAYGGSLFLLIGFQSSSYLALPIQLITVLDALWIWSGTIAPFLGSRTGQRATAGIGVAACIGWIGIEHQTDFSFQQQVSRIKISQASWQQTYSRLQGLAEERKEDGHAVNIIRDRSTWFSRKRHLGRLNYDRLIIHDPKAGTYTVEDGINEGSTYTPKAGDLLINIDRQPHDFTPPPVSDYDLIYRYDPSLHNGRIYSKR